ncbi:protein lethal(2)essential for life [Leptopilina boulardi]|uniref:protein lethal(2)essential for life n=1 Tax=Leptopilina boulardi TaxID=63433 RepID=UPI0021F5165E|nr:protein lethal(2)essential for life [Leptopilina boulardi]
MSTVPLMYRDWWDDLDRPNRLLDQYFGSGLNRDDLFSSFSNLALMRPRSTFGNSSYYRPWRNVVRQSSGGASTIQTDKDKFQVILDVQQFSPEEITVKTRDNFVIVEAKHEEKQDEHGFVARSFIRRYVLPTTHDVMQVTSYLSSDGVLTITAPQKTVTPSGAERLIDIVKTGTPAEKKEEKSESKETKITTEFT